MIQLDKEQHQAIIQRADRELALLIAEEIEHAAKLQGIAAEMETLSQRGQARQDLLTTSRATLSQAQAAHTQASVQAKLLEGLLSYADATEAATHAAQTLKRIGLEASIIEVDSLSEQEKDQRRSSLVIADRSTRLERLRTIQTERINYEQAKLEAHAAIGKIEDAVIRSTLLATRDQLGASRQVVKDLEEEEQRIILAGVETLKAWPQLSYDLRQEAPPIGDDLTGTLTRYIGLLDGLLENSGYHLQPLSQIPQVKNLWSGQWRNLFQIPESEMYELSVSTRTPPTHKLARRRDLVYSILQEYRLKMRG